MNDDNDNYNNPTFYFIVYPTGDHTKLSVAELCEATRYEMNDYSVASRQEFNDFYDAVKYAKELAQKNGLTYEHSGNRDQPDYLD